MSPTTKVYLGFVIFILLVSLRYIVIDNDIDIKNAYAVIGLISAGVVYTFTRQIGLSLFTALIITFVRTIYIYNSDAEDIKPKNYNSIKNTSIFVLALGFIYTVIHFKNDIKPYVPLTNFVLILYMILSLFEFIIHRYVMHCNYSNSFFNYIISNVPYLNDTCKNHMKHHVNVNPDMTVSDEKDDPLNDNKFRMGWNLYVLLTIAFLVSTYISKFISGYKISLTNATILSVLLAFLWQYIWNKTHVAMHEFEYKYSISRGPYDEGLIDTEGLKDLLYTNHAAHHAQKGEKKGNFNVIILGADEWLNFNNKTIDNTEYCKTHMEEKVCKTPNA